MLLSTLFEKIFKTKKLPVEEDDIGRGETDEQSDPPLRASILIGVDKQQQYFFDIKWDYENIDKTSSDLANLILGITYGLFIEQIKDILAGYNITDRPYDEAILLKTISLVKERSAILSDALDKSSNDPIIKPSQVFGSQDEKQT
jgi:hypothetical protein